jgi:MOSC domain-containing protein YiiM
MTEFADSSELESGLQHVRASPSSEGPVQLIVRRPAVDEREVVQEASLDPDAGLVGDRWLQPGETPDYECQLTLMNARVAELVARDQSRWPLAGDQLYVDLDLSAENLPPGTRLAIGSAEVVTTGDPHYGCHKFKARFGRDAVLWVNSEEGKRHNLRGIKARVTVAGKVSVGDSVRRL